MFNGQDTAAEAPKPNQIVIEWDPEGQTIKELRFHPASFKTWGFLEAVLGMAAKAAEHQNKIALAKMAAQAQAAAQQDLDLRRRLLGG